ncbi:MAG TPA: GAF domain-containing protein, partial [Chloroflexota bacterium]|nr:GAF domain-containing protein [Chloroflexota bacterium]
MAATRTRRSERTGHAGRAGRTPAARPSDLAVLNAVAEALNRSPDVRGALERALALVAELLGMQTGWVWLLDPETERIYAAADLNLPPYLRQPVQMTGEEICSCLWEFRSGTLTAKNVDVMECSRLRRAARHAPDPALAVAQTAGLRYHATIPLTFGEKPVGIMNLTGP